MFDRNSYLSRHYFPYLTAVAAALLSAVIFAGPHAWADDIFPQANFRGTETFIAKYVGDNGQAGESIYGDDDNYGMLQNIIYLQGGNRFFDSNLRLDSVMFINPPGKVPFNDFRPGGSGYTLLNYSNEYLRLERMNTTVHLGDFHLTAGDFYVGFGRGMALSMIKLDDVGIDNTLRGGRIDYHLPRHFKLTLVGGVVNSLNIDPITNQRQDDDPLDRIVGARAEVELLDALVLGAHGVYLSPRFTNDALIPPDRRNVDQGAGVRALNAGIDAEAHLGGLHAYVEGNVQTHDNYRPVGNENDVLNEFGSALYGEVSYDLSPFLLKAEGLYYNRWLMEGPYRGSQRFDYTPVPYQHLVTLEPVWMPIVSLGNEYGGKLTEDLYIRRSDTQLTFSQLAMHYLGGLLPLTGEWKDKPATTVIHPMLQVRQGFDASGVELSASGGYRYEFTRDDSYIYETREDGEQVRVHDDDGDLWHVAADVTIPIRGPHSIETKMEVRRHRLGITESTTPDYWLTQASVGYDLSGWFGLSVVHEYSNQVDVTEENRPAFGDIVLPFPEGHYFWGMLSLNPSTIIEGLTVRMIGGSQRGGIKCAGGVCRFYPDSVGGRLEAVYRF